MQKSKNLGKQINFFFDNKGNYFNLVLQYQGLVHTTSNLKLDPWCCYQKNVFSNISKMDSE